MLPPLRGRALLALACLFSVVFATPYTNQGPLLEPISRTFGLNSAEAGAIATAYFLGSACVTLFGGMLADRFGCRPVIVASCLVMALATLGSALLSPSFGVFLAWKAVAGAASGMWFPAGVSYVRRIFDGRGAQAAQGVYGAAFLAGSGVTVVLMPILAGPGQDWRLAFTLTSLAMLVVWLAWLLLAPAQPPTHTAGSISGLRAVVGERNSWLLSLVHMCGFGMAMVVGIWVTLYLVRTFGLPLTTAGALGSLPLLLGIVGRSGGGALLERSVPPVRLIRLALAGVVVGLAGMALAVPLGSLPLAMAGLLLAGLGVGAPYAAVLNGAAASVPSSPSLAQAFAGWGSVFVAAFAPPLLGGLLDLTGGFAVGFAVLAAFSLLVLASTAGIRPFSFATPGVSEPPFPIVPAPPCTVVPTPL